MKTNNSRIEKPKPVGNTGNQTMKTKATMIDRNQPRAGYITRHNPGSATPLGWLCAGIPHGYAEPKKSSLGRIMKTQKITHGSTHDKISWRVSFCLLFLFGWIGSGYATLVSGDVSGTWNKAGSPYVAIDNCTVPSGQVLTIQPGVTVIIGQDLNFDVYGRILAVGTASEPIAIKGPTPSSRWNRVFIQHGGGISEFVHCEISDGNTGVYLGIYDTDGTMITKFSRCTFTNIQNACIYGESRGWGGYWGMQYHKVYPRLSPTISNCRFLNSGTGCRFHVYATGGLYGPGLGYADPVIHNNVFKSIAGSSIRFDTGDNAGGGNPSIFNNLLMQCVRGILIRDPYDANVRNSIFRSCGIAVERIGSLSSQVGYNCFFQNNTNFAGYPGVYGQVVMANNNGTPCDVAYNIFQNPLLLDSTDDYLSPESPCVDAGDNSASFNDCFLGFPFSLGTLINDLGPYGGPGTCGWISSPTILAQPRSQSSCLGQSALFSIGAAGAQLAYQWWFNGQPLVGRTSTNLTLNNLQKANAGQYWCVVTNSSGSVTSAPTQLVVYDACIDIHMYAGLTLAGQVGSQYVLSYTTDLGNTNSWVPLATNTMSASGWFYLDMESPFSPQRFYRADLRP